MGHKLDMKERLQVFKAGKIAKCLKLAFVPMEYWEQSYTNHDKITHSSLNFSHPSIYSLLHIQFGLLGSLSQLPSTGREVEHILDRLAVALTQRDRQPLMLMGNLDSHINLNPLTAWGEHANSSQKSPGQFLNSNPGPACH